MSDDRDLWFVEEPTFHGQWSPRVYRGDMSSAKHAEGARKFRRDPVLVPDFMRELPLERLKILLSPDGEFFHQTDEIKRALVSHWQMPLSD